MEFDTFQPEKCMRAFNHRYCYFINEVPVVKWTKTKNYVIPEMYLKTVPRSIFGCNVTVDCRNTIVKEIQSWLTAYAYKS